MRGVALVFTSLALAGCAKADPVLEKKTVDNWPTANAAAVAVYFRDCTGPDGVGKTQCHSCGNELIVGPDGKLDIYADNNEDTREGNPPSLTVTAELSHRYSHVEVPESLAERAKGPASYAKFIAAKFEEGNAWCASLGGKRYDVKNLIDDAAHGKRLK
ncbi:MAG: hypothetical protein JOZ72_14550 [Alphaproteobacteria bacterium]|nr:hypothetical protein [Alphaproteobacteria bacterium]